MGQRSGSADDDLDEQNGVFFSPGRGTIVKKRLMEDDFLKLKMIGKGHFSKVYLVQKQDTGKFYAMKVMMKKSVIESRDVDNVLTERRLLECFSHPFIVNLHFAFQTNTKLFLLMDFINGGELYYHLTQDRRFSERRVRMYCAEIFLALAFLHKNRIIYRDLKLENVLLDAEGHCVITDFNFSKLLRESDDRALTFCGTVDYIAPEVLLAGSAAEDGSGMESSVVPSQSGTHPSGYDYAVDWWSLGVLAYELLFGLPPFYAQEVNDAYFNILHKPLTFPETVPVSRHCRDFIRKMLHRDPSRRLTALGIKKHPWFRSLPWRDVFERRITPPFIPEVTGTDDTRYVDPEFLGMPIQSEQVIVNDARLRSAMHQEFIGFSFSESPPHSPSHGSMDSPETPPGMFRGSPIRARSYLESPPSITVTRSQHGTSPVAIPRGRSSLLDGIAVSPIRPPPGSEHEFSTSANSRNVALALSFEHGTGEEDEDDGAREAEDMLETILGSGYGYGREGGGGGDGDDDVQFPADD